MWTFLSSPMISCYVLYLGSLVDVPASLLTQYHVFVYLVDKTGLANIGVTAQQQGSGVWVDGRQTGQMLTY